MALRIEGVTPSFPMRAPAAVTPVMAAEPAAADAPAARPHDPTLPAIFNLTLDMLTAGIAAPSETAPFSQRDTRAAAQAYAARREALAIRGVRSAFQGEAAVTVMGQAASELGAFRRALSI